MKGNKRALLSCVRLSASYKLSISKFLTDMRSIWPSDFSRRPRGFDVIDRWKATEFRQFLLYLGPVAIKTYFSGNIFNHFMLLHCAISILVNPCHAEFLSLANDLLRAFVKESEAFYGKEFIVYNVHALVHLSNDVDRFGALDTFSAFPFENQLGVLKRKLKGKKKPLQEICKRVAEQSEVHVEDLKKKE